MTSVGDKIRLSQVPNGCAIQTPTGDIVSRVDGMMHYCASGFLLSPRPWDWAFDPIVAIVGVGLTGRETGEQLAALAIKDVSPSAAK